MATYVYKYVHPDYPWLYVGKADSDVKDRVNAHRKEKKFKPFLKNAKIYYMELENKAQSKFVESYFIDKYKPHINTVDKYEGESVFELKFLPEWKPYEEYIKSKVKDAPIINNWKDYIDEEQEEISKLKLEIKNLNEEIFNKDTLIKSLESENVSNVQTEDVDVWKTMYEEECKRSHEYFNWYIQQVRERQSEAAQRLGINLDYKSAFDFSIFDTTNEMMEKKIENQCQQMKEISSKTEQKSKQCANKKVVKKKKWWEFWK